MIRVQNSWKMSSRTGQELQASGRCRSPHKAPGKMGKQNERDSHSNINCGTWTKSVILKVRRSLKPRGTDIAIGQVFLRINACFGTSLRSPGSLLSDDPIDRQFVDRRSVHKLSPSQ